MEPRTPGDVEAHDPPTAATEAMIVLAEAFLAATDRRTAVAFVCEIAEAIRRHREGEVVNLSRDAPMRLRARREAMAVLGRALPDLVRRIGGETT